MSNNQSGQLLTGVAIALFAGVLGGMLTLGVANSLSEPKGPISLPPDADQSSIFPSDEPADIQTENTLVLDNAFDDKARSVPDLIQAVEDAAGERAQFAEILAQLTQQVETLESDLINANARLALLDPVTEEISEDITGESSQRRGRSGEGRVDALIAAGVDPLNAQAYQAQEDQYQLARLDLIDQAEREGWRESDDFNRQLELLEEQQPDLRSEIGDAAYDRYLFEAGRNNRVTVRSVISGSAADLAGVAVGDTIISYNNERVFFVSELQNATREGLRGESTSVTVIRENQRSTLDMPRGPLGVTLGRASEEPL